MFLVFLVQCRAGVAVPAGGVFPADGVFVEVREGGAWTAAGWSRTAPTWQGRVRLGPACGCSWAVSLWRLSRAESMPVRAGLGGEHRDRHVDWDCVRRPNCSTKGILMCSPRRLLGIGVVAAGLAVGPAVGVLPHATASPTVNTFQIPLFLPNTILACGFQIFCVSNPVAITGERPGTVTFPAMSPEAKGEYWMHWRNLVTGASGGSGG